MIIIKHQQDTIEQLRKLSANNILCLKLLIAFKPKFITFMHSI